MRNEITSNYVWWSALSLGLFMTLQSGCTSGLTPGLGSASWLKPPSLAMPWNSTSKEKAKESSFAKKETDTIGQNTDSFAKGSTPSKSAGDLGTAKTASTPPAKGGGFSFSQEAPEPSSTKSASNNRVMPASLTTEVSGTKCDTCGEGECDCGHDHGPRPPFKFGTPID